MNSVFIYLENIEVHSFWSDQYNACNAQGQRMHYAQTNSSCSLLSTDLQVGPVADARER